MVLDAFSTYLPFLSIPQLLRRFVTVPGGFIASLDFSHITPHSSGSEKAIAHPRGNAAANQPARFLSTRRNYHYFSPLLN